MPLFELVQNACGIVQILRHGVDRRLDLIEQFLANLEVGVGAFTSCDVRAGFRLTFEAASTATVHYCLAGQGSIRLVDGRVLALRPHSFVLLPPGLIYSIEAHGAKPGSVSPIRRIRAPLFKESVPTLRAGDGKTGVVTACGEVGVSSVEIPAFLSGFEQPLLEHFDGPGRLRDQFVVLLAETARPRLGTRALTEALLKQCFVLLLRRQIEKRESPILWMAALNDHGLARALKVMFERPYEKLTVEKLATIAGMSRSKFAVRFTETLGRTPMTLLRDIRVRNAKELLITTNLSIAEIAGKVGFSSRSNFSYLFRKAVGVDPTRFRER